jgi:LmbE family N-acetylglucosaminyl deacetylase
MNTLTRSQICKRNLRESYVRILGTLAFLALVGAVAVVDLVPVSAAPAADSIAVAEAIDRLPVVGTVLLTGAHPDDENNALLAYFARGLHLRTAYLSATRGDGGQNLLGTEQYEALGILRTEELLAARSRDGAAQYFAQAYDFGFSKSAEETLEKWDRNAILGDYVRTIRRLRPDVVISRFSGTPADGHGHHQSSGILTKEAYRAAADPTKFAEQDVEGLKPWLADRLVINRGGRGGASEGFTVTLGGFSPLYGEQYGDLGMEARSSHRSQGMGGARRADTYTANFVHVDHAGASQPQELFDGIDLTLTRFTKLADGNALIGARITEIEKSITGAKAAFSPYDPGRAVPLLITGLSLVRQLGQQFELPNISPDAKAKALFLLAQKEEDFVNAINLAGGVQFTAYADIAEVIPGTSFNVTVSGRIQSRSLIQAGAPQLHAPRGWVVASEKVAGQTANGHIEAMFKVTVPADAPPTQPYWLVLPRRKEVFNVPPSPWTGDPVDPPLLSLRVPLTLASGQVQIAAESRRDVVNNYTDRIYGEREQPLAVVPAIGVWLEPAVSVFPVGANSTRMIRVRVRNNAPTAQTAAVRLQLPPGWKSAPLEESVSFREKGEEVTVRFEVAAPTGPLAGSQTSPVTAVAVSAGKTYSTGYTVISYPHVSTRYWFQPATGKLLRLNVRAAPGLKIGYIMGSGDEVATGLQQLGLNVTLLGPEDVSYGDLKQYNVIVTGIRAFEVRQDLATSFRRLDEYVKGGGYLLVQYSRPGGLAMPWSPYPMDMGSAPRVSVEEAPVEMLVPSHPLFNSPNKITAEDFSGWVQERGTYFMETWDPKLTPLLSSHDPGEPPQNGGMLVAEYGKGLYAYTGYVWFRQLPAGNAGAYRIVANLVSLEFSRHRQSK